MPNLMDLLKMVMHASIGFLLIVNIVGRCLDRFNVRRHLVVRHIFLVKPDEAKDNKVTLLYPCRIET